jgi:hypothetical protein
VDKNRHLGSTPSFYPGPLFLDRGSIIADRSSISIARSLMESRSMTHAHITETLTFNPVKEEHGDAYEG